MATTVPGYSPPRTREEFERLLLRLLRRHWQLAQLERLVGPGRRESAIDLLEVSGRARLAAVRVEFRDPNRPLSTSDLKDALDRAASLKLPIGRFVIATTANRSARLARDLFEINRASRPARIGAVEVLAWEDIEELLDEYPGLMSETDGVAKRQALTKAEAPQPLDPLLDVAAFAEADGAGEEIKAALEHLSHREHQMARLGLMQLREQRWSELAPEQRFAVLSALGVAWLRDGEPRKAAMLFIAAKSLAPHDHNACTNEAVAYELLGEHDRAHALADNLRMQFPASGRALALWLSNAPRSLRPAELEASVAPELAADPEVAMVMARRALADGDYPRAERSARHASTALERKSDPWLILGQSILLAEISEGASSDESRVKEAEACFTSAIALAQSEGAATVEVQALIGRAQARIALRDSEGAGKDVEDAHRLEREDSNGLCEYGILLRSRGSLTEAIEVFRRAVRIGGRDDAEYHLAITLRERDEPGDLQEAADLLARAARDPKAVPDGDYAFAAAAAVDAHGRLERWHDADALLAAIPGGRLGAITRHCLLGDLRRAQGSLDQASACADLALAALDSDTSPDDRRRLAVLLHDLGRYRDALPLWQTLASAPGAKLDKRRMLECAGRLGRADLILGASVNGTANGSSNGASNGASNGGAQWENGHLDLKALEQSEPRVALGMLDEFLSEHPDDRAMRLRRSVLAQRVGELELVSIDPALMPAPREIDPALGRSAVDIMRESGRPNDALAYAYELVRHHPASVDSHRAFLSALGPNGPLPHVPDFETAGPGAAVCFVEQDTNLERWVILEDRSDADEALGEYGTSHALHKALKGKHAGNKFQLPEGLLSRRTGVVKQVISKFAWRYQDITQTWASRFPGMPEIEMSAGTTESASGSEMPESPDLLFDVAGQFDDPAKLVEVVYAKRSVPIHAVADRLNLNDLQAVFVLAQRPDVPLKCSSGTEEELAEALKAFARANAVVLDLSAIATLCLLGKLNLLATWPRQFLIAQATLGELRRLQFENQLMRLPPGFSASVENNGSEAKRSDLQLKGLADAIQSVCNVRDGSMLNAIEPARRDRLAAFFGRHGAESIAIASMPGHLLWTDDRILANFARAEFGTRRVWTQAALQARVQAGNLDPAELAVASTKLAGWGYAVTMPSVELMMRAGSVAMWNPDQFPLKQALDQFASEAVVLADMVRLASEVIVRMYSDVYLRGMRRVVTMRMLDRIAQRPGGRDSIESLPRSLPIRFGLDLIRARELADVIRGWMAQNEMQSAA
jgi:tetratricopeptide (TPR) repeat protein